MKFEEFDLALEDSPDLSGEVQKEALLDACGYLDLDAESIAYSYYLEAGRNIVGQLDVVVLEAQRVWAWSLEGGGPLIGWSALPGSRKSLYRFLVQLHSSLVLNAKSSYLFEREFLAHAFANTAFHEQDIKVPALEVKRGKWLVCDKLWRSLALGVRKHRVSRELLQWCKTDRLFVRAHGYMPPFPMQEETI